MYCKEVKKFLKKLCVNTEGVIPEVIVEASRSNTYVETINPHVSDAIHWNVKRNYPETLTLEFFRYAKELVKRFRLANVTLVVDVTEENFYGEHAGLYLHGWTGERGIKSRFHYLVISILFRNKIIPFYISIMPVGAYIAEYVGQALDWTKTLNLNVSCILFDRGFYSGDLIRTLQLQRAKYLVFVPKNKWIKKMLEAHPENCVLEHEITYSKNKTKWKVPTDHVFFHEQEDYVWVFATNIEFSEMKRYVSLYKKRWNIETMFRVHDEARIKSKSVKPEIRLFYFLMSMLLLLIWNLHFKEKTVFKKFIIELHKEFEQKTITPFA